MGSGEFVPGKLRRNLPQFIAWGLLRHVRDLVSKRFRAMTEESPA